MCERERGRDDGLRERERERERQREREREREGVRESESENESESEREREREHERPKLGTYSDWGLSGVLVINKHLSHHFLSLTFSLSLAHALTLCL